MHEETTNDIRAEFGYEKTIGSRILDIVAILISSLVILTILGAVLLLVINNLEFSLLLFGAPTLGLIFVWAFVRTSQV